jgi:cell wall assembly regulator SMI1
MKKIIEILNKIDTWLTKAGYDMYPNLTKHMKDNKK